MGDESSYRPAAMKGRGATENPTNRFESISREIDPEAIEDSLREDPGERSSPATEFFRDRTRSIIATNDSPDIAFDASVNPYRGCEHGCVYCYARPTHEYLGLSLGLDFETRILVKERAHELLRDELASPRWKPKALAISGVTDPYQPIERKLLITRKCLEVLAEFRNPVGIVTKNKLVARDTDLLAELARFGASAVCLSITTLDDTLARRMEPRASAPAQRLEAIETLARAGVPVGVLCAPIIPGLNDHEAPAILKAAADSGATFAGHVPLRLPYQLKTLFEDWLSDHYPGKKEKILNRIRSLRGGALNDPKFGSRMRGEGPVADQIALMFQAALVRSGLKTRGPALSTAAFRPSGSKERQLGLFDRGPATEGA